MREADKFYVAYAKGDISEARQSLLQGIQFIESPQAEVLSPWQKAVYLFGYNARLYVLETRGGNLDDAEAALIKARYWYLEDCELDEDSPKSKVELHKILQNMTTNWLTKTITKLDKNGTGGKGPRYLSK